MVFKAVLAAILRRVWAAPAVPAVMAPRVLRRKRLSVPVPVIAAVRVALVVRAVMAARVVTVALPVVLVAMAALVVRAAMLPVLTVVSG